MAFEDWSTTAANNVLANIGLKYDEGWFPSEINNYLRAMVAQIATAEGNYPGAGYKNKLFNGGMEVWQRGAGGAASIAAAASSNVYGPDRWYISTGSNQACVMSQQAGLVSASRWSARVQRNSGQTGTTGITFSQTLTTDQLIPLWGTVVTASAVISTGADWSPAALNFLFYVGTGAEAKRAGGFTSETLVGNVNSSIAAGAAAATYKFTSAAVVPVGSTQGSIIFAWAPVGTASTNDWAQFDDVQLELGGVASPFQRTSFGEEVVRCQRFYQKSFAYGTAPAQNSTLTGGVNVYLGTGVSGTNGATIPLRPTMRVAPTVTTYNPAATNANVRDATNAADRTITVGTVSDASIPFTFASGVAASTNVVGWQADAEI